MGKKKECMIKIHKDIESAMIAPLPPRRPRSWDSLLCWPPTTPGIRASLPYFEELNGIKYDTTHFQNVSTKKSSWYFYFTPSASADQLYIWSHCWLCCFILLHIFLSNMICSLLCRLKVVSCLGTQCALNFR
ncbi:uncharacterized protein LOC142331797 [Lycorma delicatula]|uniref:uncharacterized protein LOC142331797 n=1 Tax=Lycorma delicatula TaxID=130591 RepID=UPI003F512561